MAILPTHIRVNCRGPLQNTEVLSNRGIVCRGESGSRFPKFLEVNMDLSATQEVFALVPLLGLIRHYVNALNRH